MRKTQPIKSSRPIPRLRYDPGGMRRCQNYMQLATCRWAAQRGLCAQKRWNLTNCPTVCDNPVCAPKRAS